MVKKPLSVHGSGIIIGRTEAEGRTEYLVLTNHHVADPSNYVVQDGRFLRENRNNTRAVPIVPEETYLTVSDDGADSADDIPLVEVSRDVRGDMTLLRTVGADRELPVFNGQIGFAPGDVLEGMKVITTGFADLGFDVDARAKVESLLSADTGVPRPARAAAVDEGPARRVAVREQAAVAHGPDVVGGEDVYAAKAARRRDVVGGRRRLAAPAIRRAASGSAIVGGAVITVMTWMSGASDSASYR
mgnify:CR=1 FL=1